MKQGRGMKITRISLVVLAFLCSGADVQAHMPSRDEQIAAVKLEMNDAEARVRTIVNQPVTAYPINTWTMLHVFSPGWFHNGANKPDFDKVDVRKTQEFPYAQFEYVTSDVCPKLMFKGTDLEFNANTKYYYTDRTLPKKRLSDAEMVEINRLYRIIGRDGQKLTELQDAWAISFYTPGELLNTPYGIAAQLLLLSMAGLFVYRKFYS
jgi:hypothetical protein